MGASARPLLDPLQLLLLLLLLLLKGYLNGFHAVSLLAAQVFATFDKRNVTQMICYKMAEMLT